MYEILDKRPIVDPNDSDYDALLQNLQGNILKGHGRENATLIFFNFKKPSDVKPGEPPIPPLGTVRAQLADILQCVTSAKQQLQQTRGYRDLKVPGGLFANFFLTVSGYGALGFSDAQIKAAFPWGDASSFRNGMQKLRDDLSDPPVETWEKPYHGPIDALLLMADDDRAFLLRTVRATIDRLEQFATIVTVEHGGALRNEGDEGIEHFGYADGRSQPIFFTDDLKDEGAKTKWDPSARLNLVLVPDRGVSDEKVKENAYGSYLVYRKLEQNVRGFVKRERELADQLKLEGQDRERIGAMVIGRYRDGTPLARASRSNDFTYEEDPGGAKCPFHAHIRKTNPRGELEVPGFNLAAQKSIRIVRRGIPYGERKSHPASYRATLDELPTEGVGLLFMCFQQSIETQFNHLQQAWANSPTLPRKGTGLDALIGQGKASDQQWPAEYGTNEHAVDATFGGYVKMKGGEYFFAPSIPFLRTLAPPPPPPVRMQRFVGNINPAREKTVPPKSPSDKSWPIASASAGAAGAKKASAKATKGSPAARTARKAGKKS